jgi:hypothetical protein
MLKLIYSFRVRVGKCFISSAVDIISVYGQHVVHAAYIVKCSNWQELLERQDEELNVLKKCTAMMWTGLNWCRTWFSGGLLEWQFT